MKVVIDTNVVLSAAWKDRDPEKLVLHVANTGEFEWIASAEILAEYVEVLARPKFALSSPVLARWSSIINRVRMISVDAASFSFPADPSDAKFLACALAADADFLITGDKVVHRANRVGRTECISVSEFLRLHSTS